MAKIGSKSQVFHGNAEKTSGGLKRDDLMKNKRGRIVSKRKHALGIIAFKRNNLSPKTKDELAAMKPN
jgi:hypothetical protein